MVLKDLLALVVIFYFKYTKEIVKRTKKQSQLDELKVKILENQGEFYIRYILCN